MNCKFLLQFLKVLTVGCTSEYINKVYVPIIGQGEFKNITVSKKWKKNCGILVLYAIYFLASCLNCCVQDKISEIADSRL